MMKKVLSALFVILSLGVSAQGHAAFNLAGSVITQTGTDTDLTGLAGIAGVVTTTSGGKTLYDLRANQLKLNIQGDLEFDPDFEEIYAATNINRPILVRNGGIFRVGVQKDFGGKTRYSIGDAIHLTRDVASQWDPEGLAFENGSQFFWNGGTIYSADPMGAVVNNTTVQATINKGRFVAISPGTNAFASSAMFFRNDGAPANVQVFDVELDSTNPQYAGAVIFTRNGTSVMSFNLKTGFVQERVGSTTGPNIFNNIQIGENAFGFDYEFNGNTNVTQSQGSEATNVDVGTLWRFSNGFGGAEAGHLSIFQNLIAQVKDPSGAAIEDVRMYIKSTDSGNRNDVFAGSVPLQNGRTFGGGVSTYDVYDVLTGVTGDTPTVQVLTGRYFADHTDGLGGAAGVLVDLYGETQIAGEDQFTVNFIGYGQDLFQTTQRLQGAEDFMLDVSLLPDLNITESNKAVVDAYTEINNLDQLYDRSKAYLYNNYAGETETILSGGGNLIEAGSYNLVVDATAAQVFAFDGTTITVRANTLDCSTGSFTNLTTTGTVTFLNGAAPGTCIFTDSIGTNGVVTLTGLLNANVLVYDDAAVSDDTISYQTNQSGSVSIPFNATSSADYQVVVRRQGFSEVNFEFDPSAGGLFEFPISQFRSLTIEGTPIYANSGDLAKVSMDFAGLRINVGDFTVGAQEFYDTLQDYEVTEAGMKAPRMMNYDGDDKLLLLNTYQIRSRDGATTVPGVNGFVFAETGGVLDASNGTVQFLVNDTATVDKQEQIIEMLEGIQGSAWDNNAEVFTVTFGNLVDIIGTGFDPNTDSLSNIVQSMLDGGIVDVNTMKDLVR